MSYIRPMGDGPVTHPGQDDGTFDDGGSTIVGSTGPNRVDCSELPADSPWRRPGQVCAPPDDQPWFNELRDLFFPDSSSTSTSTTPPTESGGAGSLLLLVAGGGLAYYLLTKKGR
jgi:hypothetical protein